MYMIKADTIIVVYAPHNRVNGDKSIVSGDFVLFDWVPWKDYKIKEDLILEKHEVIDFVAMKNGREDADSFWIRDNIQKGYTVLKRKNSKGNIVWGLVKDNMIEYIG